jgi:hypothetical protein
VAVTTAGVTNAAAATVVTFTKTEPLIAALAANVIPVETFMILSSIGL